MSKSLVLKVVPFEPGHHSGDIQSNTAFQTKEFMHVFQIPTIYTRDLLLRSHLARVSHQSPYTMTHPNPMLSQKGDPETKVQMERLARAGQDGHKQENILMLSVATLSPHCTTQMSVYLH